MQPGCGLVDRHLRPERVHHLLAVQLTPRGQGEQLDQARGLAPAPGRGWNGAVVDSDVEASQKEDLHAHTPIVRHGADVHASDPQRGECLHLGAHRRAQLHQQAAHGRQVPTVGGELVDRRRTSARRCGRAVPGSRRGCAASSAPSMTSATALAQQFGVAQRVGHAVRAQWIHKLAGVSDQRPSGSPGLAGEGGPTDVDAQPSRWDRARQSGIGSRGLLEQVQVAGWDVARDLAAEPGGRGAGEDTRLAVVGGDQAGAGTGPVVPLVSVDIEPRSSGRRRWRPNPRRYGAWRLRPRGRPENGLRRRR